MACAVSIEISRLQAFKMPWQQMLEEKYNLMIEKIGWHCSIRKTKSHLNQISWIAGFKSLWVHNIPPTLEFWWRNWWIQHGSIDGYNGAVERSVWYNWIQWWYNWMRGKSLRIHSVSPLIGSVSSGLDQQWESTVAAARSWSPDWRLFKRDYVVLEQLK